jgi:hypothetical protein
VIDYKRLAEPFPAKDVEWRVGSCGSGNNGEWAKVLAYVTNRAIMYRLDEVCGPQNWQSRFDVIPGGMLCGISIWDSDRDMWVTKYDGANNTDIESVKGGISDSMKRCGVQWGIGRYLYELEEGWAITQGITRDTQGARYAKTKEGKAFYWIPPALPDWALPKAHDFVEAFAARCNSMGYTGSKSALCSMLTGKKTVTKSDYAFCMEMNPTSWNQAIDLLIAKATEG